MTFTFTYITAETHELEWGEESSRKEQTLTAFIEERDVVIQIERFLDSDCDVLSVVDDDTGKVVYEKPVVESKKKRKGRSKWWLKKEVA